MVIDVNTKLADIFAYPPFVAMEGQFIASASNWFAGGKDQLTLRQLNDLQPTWAAEDMVYGLNRLKQIASEPYPYVFPVSEIGCARLIHMSADNRTTDTVCLLLAGGSYGAVCSLAESLPMAARLNELGVDCYCLNYSVATAESMASGLMPKPLEDIADAVRFIARAHPGAAYIMAGCSAGGNACALWGTEHLGAAHYGLPRPIAMLLAYPLISLLNIKNGPNRDYMLQGLFGTGHSDSLAREYAVHLHMSADYPPVYLVKAEDDTTVPAQDANDLARALDRFGVPRHYEVVSTGQHGFGLGSHTPAAGWVDRALEWVGGVV